jgi:protease-4
MLVLAAAWPMMTAGSAVAQFGLGGGESSSDRIAVFHLSGAVGEQPVDEISEIFGGGEMTSLKSLVERMNKARDDSSVKAVVVTFGPIQMGAGQLVEVRESLARIQAADKDVYVHADALNMGLYALASVADHVCMVPTGDMWITGMYGESPYLKDMLGKIGVFADFEHMGAYKSAAEVLTRNEPSDEARSMTNWLVDSIFESLKSMISDSRQMPDGKIGSLIDQGLFTAEQAKEAGLIDSVMHLQDFEAMLKDRYGRDVKFDKKYGKKKGPNVDFGSPFAFFKIFGELMEGKKPSSGDAVAIVYVEGPIIPGKSPENPFGGGSSSAGSSTIRGALQEALDDRSVKAVVLRVDSPGGSALASEIILDATKRVAAKKPVVVSMGNVAGSGGYYVSLNGGTIYADDTTITASIGVVGGKLVTTGMWDKLGINWVEYQRGEAADMMSSGERFDDADRKRIVDWMGSVYDIFKDHVVDARGDKLTKPIDEIAGGRVFTGKQALELGLVDKIGGLHDAVKDAAAQAQISDYKIRVIPKPKTIIDMLMDDITGDDDEKGLAHIGTALTAKSSPLVETLLPVIRTIDPQRVGAVMESIHRLELIQKEHVIMMMPETIRIRF